MSFFSHRGKASLTILFWTCFWVVRWGTRYVSHTTFKWEGNVSEHTAAVGYSTQFTPADRLPGVLWKNLTALWMFLYDSLTILSTSSGLITSIGSLSQLSCQRNQSDVVIHRLRYGSNSLMSLLILSYWSRKKRGLQYWGFHYYLRYQSFNVSTYNVNVSFFGAKAKMHIGDWHVTLQQYAPKTEGEKWLDGRRKYTGGWHVTPKQYATEADWNCCLLEGRTYVDDWHATLEQWYHQSCRKNLVNGVTHKNERRLVTCPLR